MATLGGIVSFKLGECKVRESCEGVRLLILLVGDIV